MKNPGSFAEDRQRPSSYPADWNVIFEPAGPLRITPEPPPFDGSDDGRYRQPYWSERYPGFSPGVQEYPVGFVTHQGAPALQVALRKDRDVAVRLRDGTTIYADIFRPAGLPADAKLPALLAWSPYGKSTPKNTLSWQKFFRNVPADRVSGFAVIEGPDPAFWARHGYAVVHVDHRGVNKSEGNIHWWGTVNAEDGHDVIEWIAGQSWSNGKVGLTGVSWLGIAQAFIASKRPPGLAAFSPRGHFHDVYRESEAVGGIPTAAFNTMVTEALMGENAGERVDRMIGAHPLMNPYWEDKRARVEDITAPIYLVAGPAYASQLFADIPDGKKWLRYARSYHLEDYYTDEALANELRFMDRYLKGIDNGWERDIPKVQIEVLEPGVGTGIARIRKAAAWPVPGTTYRKLYLNAGSGDLSDDAPSVPADSKYDATTGKVTFTHVFARDTEVTGFLQAKLWVRSETSPEMDLFLKIAKVTAAGKTFPVTEGRQRVSLRTLDEARSKPYLPIHSFRKNEFLSPGEVVSIEVGLRTTSMIFRAGEKIELAIGGNALAPPDAIGPNRGEHVIVIGGKYDSHLRIPTLPMND